MVTNEAQRQFYLSVAGIRMWYARSALPGAAPSPDFDYSSQASEWVSPVPPATDKPEPDPGSAPGPSVEWSGLKAMVADQKAGEVPGSETARAHLATGYRESSTGPAAKSPRESVGPTRQPLELGLWIGSRCALISDVSGAASSALEANLAANILRAIGDSLRLENRFVWPVFRNPAVMNDPDVFEQSLLKLGRSLENLTLVFLGFEGQGAMAGVVERLAGAEGSGAVLFPEGLGQIATAPERKRALWERLKPLATG